MRPVACLILCACLLAVGACSPADEAAALRVSRDSTDGVLRIQVTGEGPSWTPTLVASIGTVEEGPTSFARIRSLLLSPDGGVMVADAGGKSVRSFGPDGAFRWSIGRDGAGPAEYQEPYSLAWLGDTLAVLDPQNVRIGLFSATGSWLGQWPAPPLTGGSQVRLYPSGDGAIYSLGLTRADGRLAQVFVAHRASGTVDTLPDLPRSTRTSGVTCERPSDGALLFFAIPFAERRLQVPGPAGTFLVIDGGEYRIVSVTPAGDTTRIITRQVAPVPITDAEWAEAARDYEEARAKFPDLKCDATGLPRAATKPAVADFFQADDGTLWVDRWVPGGKLTEVYGVDGSLQGAFPAVDRNPDVVPSARGRRLAVAAIDPDGIPIVRIYALEPAP